MRSSVSAATLSSTRAFGPAIVSGFWDLHWVFWVGPMLGGAVAALVYDRFVMVREA